MSVLNDFKTGASYFAKIDVDQLLPIPLGTPDLQPLEVIKIDRNPNIISETFHLNKDDGHSTTVTTGFDYEYTLTIKASITNVGLVDILKSLGTADDVATLNRIHLEFEPHPVTLEVDTFDGALTSISDGLESTVVVEYVITVKPHGKPTVT